MFLFLFLIPLYCILVRGYFPWVSVGYLGEKAGYTFELHTHHHLLLVRGTYSCYFIRATNSLTTRLTQDGQIEQIQDDILKQIRENVNIERSGLVAISQEYTDAMATAECVGRQLYIMHVHRHEHAPNRHGTHWTISEGLPL